MIRSHSQCSVFTNLVSGALVVVCCGCSGESTQASPTGTGDTGVVAADATSDIESTVDASDGSVVHDASDATVSDASFSDAVGDASGDGGCTIGQAASLAEPGKLDLFGTPAYFNGGVALPAGKYRVRYVDGCMKYGTGQGWTVNAYAASASCWYVIGEATSNRIVVPPGNVGYALGGGGFASFADCVAASLKIPPVDFELKTSSRVGVWLLDSPYSDNVSGEGGRNPRWALESVGCGATDK